MDPSFPPRAPRRPRCATGPDGAGRSSRTCSSSCSASAPSDSRFFAFFSPTGRTGAKDPRKWARAAGGLLAVCSVSEFSASSRGMFPSWAGRLPAGVVGDLLGVHFLVGCRRRGRLILLAALFLFSMMLVTGLPLSGLPALVRKDSSPEKVGRGSRRSSPRARRGTRSRRNARRRKPGKDPPPAGRRAEARYRGGGPPRTAGKAFVLPPLDLLEPPKGVEEGVDEETLQENAQALLTKLAEHGIDGQITEIRTAPGHNVRVPTRRGSRRTGLGDGGRPGAGDAVRVGARGPQHPGKGVMDSRSRTHAGPDRPSELLGCPPTHPPSPRCHWPWGRTSSAIRWLGTSGRCPLLIAGATGSGRAWRSTR